MRPPLHVVLILDHAHVNGGQAKVALDSALGLKARGHGVTVFAAVGPVDPELTRAGIEVVCLDQPDLHTASSKLAYARQALWNGEARARLSALLARFRPGEALVHLHGWAKALSPSIAPALHAAGHPVVTTLHEFFLFCPNGGFYDHPTASACTRTPLSASCVLHNCDRENYARKLWRVARQVLVNASGMTALSRHVIAISELQAGIVGPLLPAGTRLHRVGNPIAVDDPGPREGSSPAFLYVGRLSPEKGVCYFLEAASRLGVPARVVGDGPIGDELRAEFPGATFLGWMGPEAVRAEMRAARALVFPSVWYEGQPLTVLEALALGCPVLVSDICAGREAVVDGENGHWFASADVDSLVDALDRLRDNAHAARLSAAAHRLYWAAPLTLERHLDAVEAVYAEAMLDSPAARPNAGHPAAGDVHLAARLGA